MSVIQSQQNCFFLNNFEEYSNLIKMFCGLFLDVVFLTFFAYSFRARKLPENFNVYFGVSIEMERRNNTRVFETSLTVQEVCPREAKKFGNDVPFVIENPFEERDFNHLCVAYKLE